MVSEPVRDVFLEGQVHPRLKVCLEQIKGAAFMALARGSGTERRPMARDVFDGDASGVLS